MQCDPYGKIMRKKRADAHPPSMRNMVCALLMTNKRIVWVSL